MRYTGSLCRCGNAGEPFLAWACRTQRKEQDKCHMRAPLTTVRKYGEGGRTSNLTNPNATSRSTLILESSHGIWILKGTGRRRAGGALWYLELWAPEDVQG